VIPEAIRDQVNLHPGDEVDFELRDGQIVLVARRHPLALGGHFANSGMAARLLRDRARGPR
jgi:AbrB family looped-hinge helix DNA binding protein